MHENWSVYSFCSDYTGLVSKIGIHFQVRDDYMNLQSQQYSDNKGFCEDLTEGKFSFPIIHSIRADPNNRQLLNILQKKSDSIELKQYALQLLERTNTFAYCRQFLADIEAKARKEIAELGGNEKLEKIIDMLHIPLWTQPSSFILKSFLLACSTGSKKGSTGRASRVCVCVCVCVSVWGDVCVRVFSPGGPAHIRNER